MDYNLQPYDENGETTGRRTIQWFRENLLPHLKVMLEDVGRDFAIDVGCGNGRFNQIIKEFGFKDVLCCDPAEKPGQMFFDGPKYKEFSFFEGGIEDYIESGGGVNNVAFFFGSPHILFKTYDNLESMVKKIAKVAIMMFDADDLETFTKVFKNYHSTEFVISDKTVLMKVVFDEKC